MAAAHRPIKLGLRLAAPLLAISTSPGALAQNNLRIYLSAASPGTLPAIPNLGAVYAGACPVSADTAVACNDDACGSSAYVAFSAVAGQTYHIRVGGFSAAATGTGTMLISQAPGRCPGDFDRGGTIQPADVAAFVSRWFADLQSGCIP
jgi:hypothetical protein